MLNKCYLGSSLHDSWSNTELLQLINSESMLLLVTEKENNTQIFKGLMEYPDRMKVMMKMIVKVRLRV